MTQRNVKKNRIQWNRKSAAKLNAVRGASSTKRRVSTVLHKTQNNSKYYSQVVSLKCWHRINIIFYLLNNRAFQEKKEKPTAPGIPRRSPIQVLTGLDVA